MTNTYKLAIVAALIFCFSALTSKTNAQTKYGIECTGWMEYAVHKGSILYVGYFPEIQDAIDFIKNDAAGAPCIIELVGELPIRRETVSSSPFMTFDGGSSGTDWGKITLIGKAKTDTLTSSNPVISLENGVSLECKAELTGTPKAGVSPVMIRNNSTGTLTISEGASISMNNNGYGCGVDNSTTGTGTINISGGTISADYNTVSTGAGTVNISGGTISGGYYAVSTIGTVNISGGMISVTGSSGVSSVYVSTGGTANISGGTVSANTGVGIEIYSAAKVTISGTAVITSATTTSGTIYLNNNGTLTDWRLRISGGTVENTATGSAIYQNSAGEIQISGGRVLAKEGYALNKGSNGTGTINLSNNGIVFAYGENEENVISGTYTQTGNAVLCAWNKSAGTSTYTAGTSDDIFKLPAAATAVWAIQDTNHGISVTNGTNIGFIPVADVTVGGVGIKQLTMDNGQWTIYPNPTTGKIVVSGQLSDVSVEIYDIVGRVVLSSAMSKLSPETTIDISHLANGMYFLKVDGKVVKIIKE